MRIGENVLNGPENRTFESWIELKKMGTAKKSSRIKVGDRIMVPTFFNFLSLDFELESNFDCREWTPTTRPILEQF